MTNKEKKEWLGVKYPLTIIRDRYDGVYSRACWLAFPLDYDEIPEDVTGDDVVCSLFWETYKEPVGKGAYANDAVIDLMERMEAPEFPEESEEDEHRRKDAIYFLESAKKHYADTSEIEKTIAWLEKQKDNSKTTDSIPSDCTTDAKCGDRWYKVEDFLPDNGRDVLAKDALGNFLIANYDGDRWYISGYDNEDKPIVYTPAIKEWCDIPSEKQKEQKQTLDLPAGFYFIDKNGKKYYTDTLKCGNLKFIANQKEPKPSWSEEDKQMVDEIIGSLCDSKNLIIESDSHWLSNPKLKDISREIAWLKSLRPQPKQDWSEEDDWKRKELIQYLEGKGDYRTVWMTWLKSIRPQKLDASKLENFDPVEVLHRIKKEWPMAWEKVVEKPEWSEEDRRTIDRACVALRAYANGELPDILPSEILGYADKLQSLRPSWKPSEEQMSMLLAVIRDPNNAGSESCFLAFKSLYEQLKKL